jgi:hypothetical protein
MSIGERVSNGFALIGALLALGFGTYLLLVGLDVTFVTPEGLRTVTSSPTLAGLVPLAIGVVALWAVATRRTNRFWLAAALAIACAVLFLFSISLQLAVIATLLVAAALARTVTSRDVRER